MINILINEPDRYYRNGLIYLLHDLFLNEYNLEVNFNNKFSHHNIWNAHVILLSLIQGEAFTCKPELKFRNRGIIIGLTDSFSKFHREIPLCYRDIVLIPRQSTQDHIYSTIVQAWNKNNQAFHYPPGYSCADCPHKMLTVQQYTIALELLEGKSVGSIATKLNISEKTIYNHKYHIMKKFNINNNKDFSSFLDYISKREACTDRNINGHDAVQSMTRA
ncbi:helix-turn-helix domain-containing protein [Pseudenterobacter timonensis]|uniref:helix-turn-helix domain-containing protein n=1 Tax=Pseudenterobacter timonensis TaxID=1755099 RepID=UPI0028773FE7|nr:helix-turn-helix transcriptional regulator [Pseudenterobacter timonensis]